MHAPQWVFAKKFLINPNPVSFLNLSLPEALGLFNIKTTALGTSLKLPYYPSSNDGF
jgi:hypothetical protein